MSITTHAELLGITRVSDVVGDTLKQMREYARPGMSTKELDDFGRSLLQKYGAQSAPKLMYGFPGWTCISINNEVAHGIPSAKVILKEGDLVNIDVSAELDGFFADNGGSFILGNDKRNLSPLIETSKRLLMEAIGCIRGGVRISEIGRHIETEARRSGFKVIKNLVGHGIGRSLHEEPSEIPCFHDRNNMRRFKKNSVVAIETFISTGASYAAEKGDGWTYITRDGSFVAQHEHTILITDTHPVILTEKNDITF
ncbi:type I methionyl aminopeptidase [Chryseosolibacter indicus]|uniref:Methionine aminopeptidase n=1 Tax=Chryseosolibacter indicus TaxID=2782351 RepID=A0ABS5VN50_9BACT|nr:type I methionyl aminopeptidase [Chryseosolibacter indicus]MBT1702169.1 type I methionyl aminopeptidase [Chryseosolibacter indicus]